MCEWTPLSGLTYILKLGLQQGNHVFFDNHPLIVEILNDEIMAVAIDIHDDGFDGGIALDQDAWQIG